jgi:hypothetical protein
MSNSSSFRPNSNRSHQNNSVSEQNDNFNANNDDESTYNRKETQSTNSRSKEDDVMIKFAQEKPRKLEEDTIKYLLEIDSQLKAMNNSGDNDQETKEILISNVFTEIQSRTASIACDRQTNFIFEQLCYYLKPYQLLSLLQKWTCYAIFLARNRFASHIVQV